MRSTIRLLIGLAIAGVLLLGSRLGVNAYQPARGLPIAGTWDTTFAQNLQQPATISSLTIDQNGDLYVLGDFHYVNGQAINGLTKWDGTTWETFNLEPDDINKIRAVTTYSDTLYIAGRFKTLQQQILNGVAAWNDTTFQALGSGLSGTLEEAAAEPIAYALPVYSDTLYIGGNFSFFNGGESYGIAQWNGAGIAQSVEFNSTVGSFISTPEGIIAAGEFWTVNFEPAQLARREYNRWTPINFGWPSMTLQAYTIHDTPYLVTRSRYAPYPSQLYRWQNSQRQLIGPTHPGAIDMLVGFDDTFYMQSGNKLWFLNQNQWVPAQLPFEISKLTALASDGETLYLAGDLTVDGQSRQLVAWDGSTTQSLGSFVGKQNVQSITGDFGQPMIATKPITVSNSGTIQRWNGSQWNTLAFGDTTISEAQLQTLGQRAYVLLNVPRALNSAAPASNIWHWENESWQSGVLSTTSSIKWHRSGQQLFTVLLPLQSNLPITGVVEFDGETLTQRLAINSLSPYEEQVFVHHNEFYLLIIAPWQWVDFLHIYKWDGIYWQSLPTQSLAKIDHYFAAWNNQLYMANTDGQLYRFDQAMQPIQIAQFDGPITTMQSLEGGGLYIGGDFMQVDGVTTGPIARFDGTTFRGLPSYPNGTVRKLAVDYNQLYIVGDFSKVGQVDSLGVAVFSFATPELTPTPTNTPTPTSTPTPTPTATISPTPAEISYRVYAPLTWAKPEE